MQAIEHKKAWKGMGMEGRVAFWYAKNTRKDMAEFENLAARLANETPPHSSILDLAPGPGYFSIELAKRGQYQVTGLDISRTFIEIARENARKGSVAADFQLGNASAMPFRDNTFDLIVCRAAFKNFSEPDEALNEMFRVLKPGGRALIIDLRKDVRPSDINAYIAHLGLGWFDALIMKLTFRCMLIPRAYTAEQFRQMAAKSNFGKCDIATSAVGLEVTLRK